MKQLSAFLVATALLASGPALAASPAPMSPAPGASPAGATPSAAPSAVTSPAASTTPAVEPAIVRIGTAAVLSIRLPLADITPAERARVVQSRVNHVLLNHPYLTWADVKVLREGGTPVIYWGRFPIVSVDAAHAKLNNYSSPDILAHAWANSLRAAAKTFFAAKKMPERALYRNERGSDFVFRRTTRTFADQSKLRNTSYLFSPEDLVWGSGVREAGQNGFVVFTKVGAGNPPDVILLGNNEGTFTEYDRITEDDQP
jgi:hypothetical protein